MMQHLYQLLDDYDAVTGADAKAIEAQIWQTYGQDRAVLVLDMSGFSRLTRRFGIVHYLALVRRMQKTSAPLVAQFGGVVVKFEADNLYATFADPLAAVHCARAVRDAFETQNNSTPDEKDVHVSIGLAWGKILVVEDHDYFGDAVNVACKLGEDLAKPAEILIDNALRERLPAELPGLHLTELDLTVSGLRLQAWGVVTD